MRLPRLGRRRPSAVEPTAAQVLYPGPWRHRDIYTQGIRLHVADSVPTTPQPHPLVLCVHGFAGCWSDYADLLVPLAAAGWHAVAVDLRGYGESDKPPTGYDLPTAVADLTGLIQALGYSEAVLIGHGEGAATCLSAAALAPQHVRAIVSLSCPHPLTLRAAWWRDPQQWWSVMRPTLYRLVPHLTEWLLTRRRGYAMHRRLAAGSAPGFLTSPAGQRAEHRARITIRIPRVAQCAARYRRWIVRGQLSRSGRRFFRALRTPLAQPVVVVQGELDPWVTRRSVLDMGRYATSSTIHVLPGVGHFVPLEAPEQLLAVLQSHLQQWRRQATD